MFSPWFRDKELSGLCILQYRDIEHFGPFKRKYAVDIPWQGLSLLSAISLKALGPHRYCDNDDDYAPERALLLRNAVQPPPYVVGDPIYGSKNGAWSIRINDKVKCFSHICYSYIRPMLIGSYLPKMGCPYSLWFSFLAVLLFIYIRQTGNCVQIRKLTCGWIGSTEAQKGLVIWCSLVQSSDEGWEWKSSKCTSKGVGG